MNDKDKFFWMPVKNTKVIVLFWFFLALVCHLLYVTQTPATIGDSTAMPGPDLAVYEQLATVTRQLFFVLLFVYSAIRIIFAGLSFWSKVATILQNPSHPHAGYVILGLCIILAGALIAGGNAILKP